MHRRLLSALVASASLALPVAASAAPAGGGGWQTHRVPTARFAVDTPKTWVDFTSAAPKILTELAKDPTLHSLIEVARTNKLVKLLCADRAGVPNVNVVELSIGKTTLATFAAVNVTEIRHSTLVRGRVTSKPVTLPSGQSVEVNYDEAVGQGPVVHTLQYYFVHGTDAYVLTFTSSPASKASIKGTFLRSARSFRFIAG